MPDELPEKELPESEFIQEEGIRKNPYPFWIWLFLIAIIIIIISSIQSWYSDQITSFKEDSPFFDVTNRQFSLFLWENPQFMRVNVSSKEAYLPGFQYLEKVTPQKELADKIVQAPPDLLFHYHTWARLIGKNTSPRIITPEKFQQFLEYATEWKPCCWPDAPKGYKEVVDSLPTTDLKNLEELPREVFPVEVRNAFIGWLNFFYEGEEINAMEPTYGQLSAFMKENPTYARNYWRNIVNTSTYLYDYTFGGPREDIIVAKSQMAPFLRVALFNFIKANEENQKSHKEEKKEE